MSKYDKTGGYAGYNKNNQEREPLDYYATPPEEVANGILTIKPWDLNNTKDIIIYNVVKNKPKYEPNFSWLL